MYTRVDVCTSKGFDHEPADFDGEAEGGAYVNGPSAVAEMLDSIRPGKGMGGSCGSGWKALLQTGTACGLRMQFRKTVGC